ncbi:MAG: amidophosphoribosyltransferase [Smithellaceae bacterium]|jgi:amidophosphoribosyltransferase|nr:amidophosphoribosyltransferase [Smithellaceae bacterium]MDD3848708.1 amidophosphoribosyltransferase [Smithellaceae bacterium]HOG12197.1 amidophosphoribosyltransferase [Smithellaceae bacterium]HOQ72112.1 amidophosphoribosyltransferase [Smithellaceae bacterium]HPL10392.1 amidophosphoribosyltransferase [Smithellaceae bacterium]
MLPFVEGEQNDPGRPREACGLFAIYGNEDAARVTYFGLFALQHRGQESAGVVVSNGCSVFEHKGMGLASTVFNENILQKLTGSLAIGHVRYSTTGSSTLSNAQPFLVHVGDEYYALGHNGNIVNAQSLRSELEGRGSIFQSTMDSEVIVHLMAPHLKRGLEKALCIALQQVEGAYSLVMLTRNRIVAARDPRGFRPLALGKLNGGWVVASETCAFDLVGAEYIRDVEPGEILIIDADGCKSLKPFAPVKPCHCIFELIYFSRPDSQIFGQNVYLCRKRLGHELAREYRPDVDLVMPFPDSGNYAAIGYAEESGIPFEMGMIRNHYVGRTFIQPTQPMRDFGVRVKLNPVKPLLAGRKVMIVEDSVIRGTTSRNRVKNLREIGVKELHMVISCPPTLFPCPYGIDFSSKGELIAAKKETEQAIAEFIGLDSLHYLTVDGMVRATGLSKDCFCLACYTGDYPIAPPVKIDKYCMELN